jgi:catechol 2,3-dioxygenase-like lactoylglutathione lyase family enzyme
VPITPTRIFHVNVNCSDLGRSLDFYRDVIGLEPTTRTAPVEPQAGGAFGLEQVQWDAWMMRGDAGYSSPVLDLLEWIVPRPSGVPATEPTATGFNRLGISTPDVAAMHARVTAAAAGLGLDVWSEPMDMEVAGGSTTSTFICGDPDGTQIEIFGGRDTRLSHIVVNCADLDRSARYYADVIGLTPLATVGPVRQPAPLFRLGGTDSEGTVEMHAVLLQDPASGFVVELIEWIEPKIRPAPRRRANDLGIFRMAWVTEDIDADYDTLDEAGVECFSPPAKLTMGPGLPDLRALSWADPDGACLELIESPT